MRGMAWLCVGCSSNSAGDGLVLSKTGYSSWSAGLPFIPALTCSHAPASRQGRGSCRCCGHMCRFRCSCLRMSCCLLEGALLAVAAASESRCTSRLLQGHNAACTLLPWSSCAAAS